MGGDTVLQNRQVKPGFKKRTVITEEGELLTVPGDWAFLPAGDGVLTRNVKKLGTYWQVQVKMGKRLISKGIWTNQDHIETARQELAERRASPEYEKKRSADLRRRARKHEEYVQDFYQATLGYLNFHSTHEKLAMLLARAITEHATPIGSGTVARTERIPLEKRVEAAVIAWLRHQTTSYERMTIPRIKGRRREVRRMLAEKSLRLLEKYRRGEQDLGGCPLRRHFT